MQATLVQTEITPEEIKATLRVLYALGLQSETAKLTKAIGAVESGIYLATAGGKVLKTSMR